MPRALPFKNAYLIRAYFDYDTATGKIKHKPTAVAARATGVPIIRRTNNFQYRYEGCARSDHRLIWAMHHPENPNPPFIIFLDGDKTNTRIENLMCSEINPRWIGHTKKSTEPMRQLPNGKFVTRAQYDDALAAYQQEQATEAAERQSRFWNNLRDKRALQAELRAPRTPEEEDQFAKVLEDIENSAPAPAPHTTSAPPENSAPTPAPNKALQDLLNEWD